MKISAVTIILPLVATGVTALNMRPSRGDKVFHNRDVANQQHDAANDGKSWGAIGGILSGVGTAVGIGEQIKHWWDAHHQNQKRATADGTYYNGNIFQDNFKQFASSQGVSIPDVSDYNAASSQMQSYTIADGDTGNAIAQRYGITFQQLEDANSMLDWNNLQIGDTLNIPSSSS